MAISLVMLFSAALAVQAPGAGKNLLANGSFEELGRGGLPAGWYAPPREVAAQRVAVVADEAAEGRRSLRLSSRALGQVRVVSEPVAVSPGQWLLVRWKCKTRALDGGASVDPMLPAPLKIDGVAQAGTVGWTAHEYYLCLPAGARELRLALALRGAGEAWFDELSVAPCPQPQARAPGLAQSCFELPAQAGCRLAYNYPVVKIFPDDPWPAGAPAEAVRLSLARNEYEAFQLLLQPQRKLTISRARAVGAAPLKITVRRVGTIDLPPSCAHDVCARPGPNPDPLYPLGTLELAAGERAVLWVEVYAPKEAPAGALSAKLRLEGSATLEVPLRLRVWRFALPEKPRLRSFASTAIRDYTGRFRARREELLPALVENLRRHRVAPWELATGDLVGSDWVKLRPDGGVDIDFAAFDRGVEAYHAQGFEGFVIVPRNFRARTPRGVRMRPWLSLVPLTAEFDRAYGDFCRKMAQHLRERGWIDEAVWYPWDEPNEREYDEFEHIVRLIKSADEGLRVAVAGAQLPLPRFYGLVDMWTTNLRWYEANTLQRRISEHLAAGDRVGGYGNNRYQVQFPLTWPRAWGWTLFRYGLEHTGWWSVCLWRGEGQPRRGARQTAAPEDPGAGMFLYPPAGPGGVLCDSLRWEAIRDGVEDYEYLCLLAERSGRERALEAARQIAWGSFAWEFERDAAKIAALREKIAAELGG